MGKKVEAESGIKSCIQKIYILEQKCLGLKTAKDQKKVTQRENFKKKIADLRLIVEKHKSHFCQGLILEEYGQRILNAFLKLKFSPSDLALKFGYTKEWGNALYHMLYDKPYIKDDALSSLSGGIILPDKTCKACTIIKGTKQKLFILKYKRLELKTEPLTSKKKFKEIKAELIEIRNAMSECQVLIERHELTCNRFIFNSNEKYKKKGGLRRFKKLIEADTSLTEIGKAFGFSKEWASTNYQLIYGKPFNSAVFKKALAKEVQNRMDSRAYIRLMRIALLLCNKGFKAAITSDTNSNIIEINLKNTKRKILTRPMSEQSLSNNDYLCSYGPQNRDVDFIIYEYEKDGIWYIMPWDKPPSGKLLIPKDRESHKYTQFLNAWKTIK